jgi:glycosyltransferase involved in cell wall biosynthesis
MGQHGAHLSYVLITPARNEEKYIEKLIQSMIHQTILPEKWVIVNDGSTDATGDIIKRYLPEYAWIEIVQLPQRRDRSFAGKVHAFNAGLDRVKNVEYEVLGNLDADVSFCEDYLEFLLGNFKEDSNLGVAGTIFKEEGYSSDSQSFEGHTHVAGGCQLFRRTCFEVIGGYVPNKAGGIDWIAVSTARMLGWKTRSFREKWFFHYRHLGTAERSGLASSFSYGEKDYYLGGHPIWEIFRVLYRMAQKPYVIGGTVLGLGYVWAFLCRVERPVSYELMKFHRKEQMEKLKRILKSILGFQRVDSFKVMSGE